MGLAADVEVAPVALVAVLVPMVVCVEVAGWVDDGVGVEESSVEDETVNLVVEAVDGPVLSAVEVGALAVVAEADALLADVVEGAPVAVEGVLMVLLSVEDWLDVDVRESVVDGLDDVSGGVVVGLVSRLVVAVCRDVA